MARINIDVGTNPNDHTGSNLRDAFIAVNSNFTELYADDAADTLDAVTTLGNTTTNSITVGGLIVDTNTLYVDSTNNRVGIGTTSPQTMLDLASNNNLGTALNTLRFTDTDPTAVTDAEIGKIEFFATDTNAVVASIVGHNADPSPDGYLAFNTAEGTVLSERLRIKNNGNVGIGTDSPSAKLEVIGGTNNNANSGLVIKNSTGATRFAAYTEENVGVHLQANEGGSARAFMFDIGGSEAMRITSGGNVGIGTTSPSYKFTAYGSNTDSEIVASFGSSNDTNEYTAIGLSGFIASNGATKAGLALKRTTLYGAGELHFLNNTTTDNSDMTLSDSKMMINSTGNVGIGTTSPSATLEVNKGSEGEYLRVGGDNANNARSLRFTSSTSSTSSVGALHTIKANSVGGEIAFANGDGNIMYLQDGGNVGIGTTSPAAPLTVKGEAFVQEAGVNGEAALRIQYGTDGNTALRDRARLMSVGYSGTLELINSSNSLTTKINSTGSSYFNGGNVGIGTTSPSRNLTISSSGTSTLQLTNTTLGETTTDGFQIKSYTSGAVQLWNYENNYIAIATNNSERMRIDSSGQVGIGLTNATAKLHVVDTSNSGTNDQIVSGLNSGSPRFKAHIVSYNGVMSLYDSGTNEDVRITSKGGEDSWINNGGKVGIGTSSPSYKLSVDDSQANSTIARFRDNSGTAQQTLSISSIATGMQIRSAYNTGISNQLDIQTAGGNSFLTLSPNSTEAMRIDSSGNVGIGEADPDGYWSQARQLVLSGTNNGLTIKSSTAGNGRIVFTNTKSTTAGLSDGGMISYSHQNNAMIFNANGSEAMRIDSSGNVGIGTTSPAALLDISSTTDGVLLPRMTTTQVNAISSPENGLTVYNTTLNTLCFYNGTSWQKVTSANM